MKLTVPVVNMNGNSKQSLVDEAMGIHITLCNAIKAIRESDLRHGRNYQTAPKGTNDRVIDEQQGHMNWLRARAGEYMQLAIDISEQGI